MVALSYKKEVLRAMGIMGLDNWNPDTDPVFGETDILIDSSISVLSDLGAVKIPFTKDSVVTADNFYCDKEICVQFSYLHTKLIFDPPESGYATTAMKEMLEEIKWRIKTTSEERRAKQLE